MADQLIVVGGLDVDARNDFVATARVAIDHAAGSSGGDVGLDCSQVESLDEGTLAMLVMVARAGRRRGVRVTLVRVPVRVRAQLEGAGVSHFFDRRRRRS